MTFKYADMFCGIGGFRLALRETDSKCVFSSDYDKDAVICYEALFGEKPYDKDIRTYDYHQMPDIDLLCGGFPCFAFSQAGERKGFESEDPRSQMFFELAKILEIKKPRMFWFENVKGLLNHDEGRSFAKILIRLGELGYDVEWFCPNAKNFGIPVNRERIFIVGHLRGTGTKTVFPFTIPTCNYDRASRETPIFQYRFSHFEITKGIVPTLTASMGVHANDFSFFIRNNALRRLTPRECFRFQGLYESDIDKLIGTNLRDSALYERAGRTVFQPIVRIIAKRIECALNNTPMYEPFADKIVEDW